MVSPKNLRVTSKKLEILVALSTIKSPPREVASEPPPIQSSIFQVGIILISFSTRFKPVPFK